MSFHTVYVLLAKDGTVRVGSATAPDTAQEELKWAGPGEISACRISEEAASELVLVTSGKQRGDPVKLLKFYSHSMQKVGDVH